MPPWTDALEIDAMALQEVCAAGWMPVEQAHLGGWVLRAAPGFTNRANSVLVTGDPPGTAEEALREAADWYRRRNLPFLVQVPLPAQADLAEDLRARGAEDVRGALVMVAPVAELAAITIPAALQVALRDEADEAWLARFADFREERSLPPAAGPVLASGDPVFATAQRADGTAAGIGRGALTGGWLGISAMYVDPDQRGGGVGRGLMAALARRAAAAGIARAYLQVFPDNVAAIRLYRRLGFTEHHRYTYLQVPAIAT